MPTLVLQVKVKPSARESVLVQSADGGWSAQLKSPPVDGKANQELIALVARHFGCSKAAVSIRSGASGRLKRVQSRPEPLRPAERPGAGLLARVRRGVAGR